MEKRVFRYSIPWRISFIITVPVIFGLVLIYLGRSGSSLHFNLTKILVAISFVPYFFLIIKFMEKYIVDETEVTQKNIFVNRTLRWKSIIEYRDFFNVIILMPVVLKQSINIYFYRNIARYKDLRKYFADGSRVYEANVMIRKRERVFLIIDIGPLPILLLMAVGIVAVALFSRFPQFNLCVFLTAVISGVLFVLSSVAIWMILHDLTPLAEEYGHIMATIMSVTLMVPLIIIAGPVFKKEGSYVAGFLLTYFLGYAMGWGGMCAFFPNRELKKPKPRSK